MGGNLWATTAAWTFLYLVQVLSADRSLFQDLGLNALLDVTKINISQDEYTRMMSVYLNNRQEHSEEDSIPKLITFYPVKKDWWLNREDSRLIFPIRPSGEEMEVESAQLRILAPAFIDTHSTAVRVQVNQVLGTRRRRVIEDKLIYLSPKLTKWCEFEVTSAVQSWLNGERNLGLELVCIDCKNNYLKPVEVAISALVYPKHKRYRRSSSPYQSERRTDCRETRKGTKRKCCRHNMNVKFAELRFPEMVSIVQPKSYEAGFCQGQCPPNYNHATNHSRIQSLLHQMDRKNAKRLNRRAIPKACCTPSKLKPLEILRVNPSDGSKLIVERWDNMEVVECACS